MQCKVSSAAIANATAAVVCLYGFWPQLAVVLLGVRAEWCMALSALSNKPFTATTMFWLPDYDEAITEWW